MSCIAALIEKSIVHVACDSQYTDGDSIWMSKYPKWKTYHDNLVLVACIGNPQSCLIVNYFGFPNPAPQLDDVLMWLRDMRPLFPKEVEPFSGLVVGNGKIFSFDHDFVALEQSVEYEAEGSGRDLAIGALFALKGVELHPLDKVRRAVEAARTYNPYVGGTIHTISI